MAYFDKFLLCSVGDTITASGGGQGFAATVTAVSSGAITQVYITDPVGGPLLLVPTLTPLCQNFAKNVSALTYVTITEVYPTDPVDDLIFGAHMPFSLFYGCEKTVTAHEQIS